MKSTEVLASGLILIPPETSSSSSGASYQEQGLYSTVHVYQDFDH